MMNERQKCLFIFMVITRIHMTFTITAIKNNISLSIRAFKRCAKGIVIFLILNVSMHKFSFSVHNTVKGLRRPTAGLKFDVRGKENYG